MEVRHLAIYRIYGAASLQGGTERVRLLRVENPAVTVTLTTNAEVDFLHVDKSLALAAQLLKGIFAPDKEGSLQERLAAEVEEVRARREKRSGKGVLLVFECETEISAPEFKARRDTGEFGICIDAVEKQAIREIFRPTVQATIIALGLALPANADHRVEKLGDAVYLIDPDGNKPVYTFSFQGGHARVSGASPLTGDVVAEVAALASKLAGDKTMARSASLLVTSLEEATEELQGFVAAWSALEIFVNATFKNVYEKRWLQIIEGGAPTSAKPALRRFHVVMSARYRPADKFLIIASLLDPAAAVGDTKEFRRLKKFRDGLFHTLNMASSPLPMDAVQKLLLKYVKLHLIKQQA